jgi:DNA-binding transcriptional LysR family regulator
MNPALCIHGPMSSVHDAPAGTSAAEGSLTERLVRVDLNLLVAFDALAREQNVTRAAERVGVTQSAMSHALRRLRELFDDPLLVRGQNGMVLTARAEALVVPLRGGLVTIDRALGHAPAFEAATARRTFRLASPDLFDILAIPILLERIRAEAPGVDLVVSATDGDRLQRALETGEVDLAITPRVDDFQAAPELDGSGLVRRVLFRDGFSCFCRTDHPALVEKRRTRGKRPLADALSLETYVSLSHALVSPRGEGSSFVDELLAEQGHRRRLALRVPHFFTALAIVEHSDLILTAPSSLARLIGAGSNVVALPAPLRLPEHAIQMLWHERFSNEPGHTWLREILLDVAKSIAPRAPPATPR